MLDVLLAVLEGATVGVGVGVTTDVKKFELVGVMTEEYVVVAGAAVVDVDVHKVRLRQSLQGQSQQYVNAYQPVVSVQVCFHMSTSHTFTTATSTSSTKSISLDHVSVTVMDELSFT